MNTDDDITIGIAKLRLTPGDTLILSVPACCSAYEIAEFQSNVRQAMREHLVGVTILIASNVMQISVRRGEPPPDLRLVPPAGEA
jgi:hypothetical protein